MAFVHGHRRRIGTGYTPEYRAWSCMKVRCENRGHDSYPRYGGRGIVVCKRWRHDFLAFLADMGPRPSPVHSLDRKNNDGPYCKSNCRWATREQQMANRGDAVRLTFRGRTLSIAEWARELGILRNTLWRRITHSKWDVARALTTPVMK